MFRIPLDRIGEGTTSFTATAVNEAGRQIASVTIPIVKRPYRAGAVQINQFGRFISQDGKGLLPLSMSIGFSCGQKDAVYWADLLKNAGFHYITFMPFSRAFSIGLELIEKCQNYGINVIFWEDWRRKSENFEVRKLDILELPYSFGRAFH